MPWKSLIEKRRNDAAGLEGLFRQSGKSGDGSAFKEAIRECVRENPGNLLFTAWAYRLDILTQADSTEEEDRSVKQDQIRHWRTAIAASIVLGVLYALFAGDKPPIPMPGEGNPLFWIGWGPLTALGLLFYMAALDRGAERLRRYGLPVLILLPVAVYTALIAWDRTDPIAILIALHLPFVAWAAVGAGVILGHPHPFRHGYAYLVKSVETLLTGGIYFGAGLIFMGLTFGIFEALGIELSQDLMRTVGAWGIGAIPILALASVYDPTVTPAEQPRTSGFTRILNILMRLILPLALGVLAVYIFWFIPVYFWRPFQEREALVVYNATIMAILGLMTVIITGHDEDASARQYTILRYAILLLGIFTLLLNVYALAAVVGRTLEFGLSPNRYAVLGWNLVTLIMLGVMVTRLWRAPADGWISAFRDAIARVPIMAVVWALWVLIGLPLSFK